MSRTQQLFLRGRRGLRRPRLRLLVVAALAAHGLAPGSAPAVTSSAGGLPPRLVVSENPANWTPHVLDGRVDTITQIGHKIFVGGRFGKVREAGGKDTLTRKNIFAFDARTGAIDKSFDPTAQGGVNAIVPAPDGKAIFVGGQFTKIAGKSQPALAKLDLAGKLVSGFRPSVESRVDALAVQGSRLFFSGQVTLVNGVERWGLAAVDVVSGALDPGVAVQFTEPIHGDVLTVTRLALRPDGTRLVALGSFLKADGLDRPQLAMLDVTGPQVSVVADWRTGGYAYPCSSTFGPTYIRGVDVSPDGSYFVVVSTGGKAKELCDTVARFEFDATGLEIQPTWRSYSGGDSFISVAVTDAAIYVGGHQRWMNNYYHGGTGLDALPGTGSVPRPGISALDPRNGVPLSWNPGREPRGIGVFAFLDTPDGLWVGSDTDYIGGEHHPKLAFLPAAGGKRLDLPRPNRLPGVIYRTASSSQPGLVAQPVDSTGAGKPAPPAGALDWASARVAFPVEDRLFAIWGDGRFDSRPVAADGSFGAPTPVDLRGLDTLEKAKFVPSTITGMAYDAEWGRIWYTIEGKGKLYYRGYSLESGVVGDRFVVADEDSRWKKVRGLMVADGRLYYATGSGDDLTVMDLRDGLPVVDTARSVGDSSLPAPTTTTTTSAPPTTQPPPVEPGTGSPVKLTLTPDADARVESKKAGKNFGSSSTLAADTSPKTSSFLRFVVPSSVDEVTRAKLRLYVSDSSKGGAVVYPTGSSWSESGVTWDSRPARTGPEAGRTGKVKSGKWVEVDVTTLVSGPGPVTFELAGASSDGVEFKSRNSSKHRPELVVEAVTP